jgi:hypothetical protein
MSERRTRSERFRLRAFVTVLASAAVLGLGTARALGATALAEIRVSPDTTLQLGALTTPPGGVVRDDLHGSLTLAALGPIPAGANVDAYDRLPNGDQLLSFDTTIVLPGGLTVRPADVVKYNGSIFSVVFDAAAHAIPQGVDVDAVTVRGGALLLSFDTTVDLGSFRADDEDLVLFDQSGFSAFFDGSAAGIDPALDLDGVELLECNDHLLLSFDGSGTVGALRFDDEDVLEFDRVSAWQMAYDGSANDPDWSAADLDAISATVDPGPGPATVFGQTVRFDPDKTTFRWTAPALYRAVRGSFAAPGSIGAYLVTMSWSGSGTSFPDVAVPSAGAGLWYLVKPGGCSLTSWQSTLGAEPGRDASIP